MKKFLKSKSFVITSAAALIIGGDVYAFVHFANHPHHVVSRIMYNSRDTPPQFVTSRKRKIRLPQS